MPSKKNILTLKSLTKGSAWDLQENDIARMWNLALKESDFKENRQHYLDVIRCAFELEEVKIDKPVVIEKMEQRGFKVFELGTTDDNKSKWGIKKRPIRRITDLTYENISHITAAKLIEVLDNNFGGGWDSIPQNIKDIILSSFDISTTTLPTDRIHKKGGMFEKMVAEQYEVLEIQKGSWTEAIFAKLRPVVVKPARVAEERDFGDDEELTDDESRVDDYEDDDDITNESYLGEFDPEDAEEITIDDVEASEEDY